MDWRAVTNTLLLGLSTSSIAIPVGLVLARLCLYSGVVPRVLWLSCLCLVFVPLFMQVSAWDSAFGKLGWLINVQLFNGTLANSWAPAIWIHAMAAVPQVALIVWFGLWKSGRAFEDQASLDADQHSVFWHVTLPRILPLIGISIVWIMASCAREIAVTDIYRIGTIAEQIYLGYSLGEFEQPLRDSGGTTVVSIAIGIIWIMACCALILMAFQKYVDRYLRSDDVSVRNQQPASAWQNLTGLILIAIIVLIPAANLLIRASKHVVLVDGSPVPQYSLANLMSVVSNVPQEFATELQWSFLIAAVSSVMILTLAIAISWMAIESSAWQLLLMISFAICCSLPGPLIGTGLLQIRNGLEIGTVNWLFDRTIFAPVIANLVFCWPMGCIPVWMILHNTASDSLEHAKTDGVSSVARLLRIVLAGNFVACCGCLLIVFAICFGELSASQLVVPPGMDTLPRRMLGMLHSGVDDTTAGLTIVTVFFILAICGCGWTLVRLNRTDNGQ